MTESEGEGWRAVKQVRRRIKKGEGGGADCRTAVMCEADLILVEGHRELSGSGPPPRPPVPAAKRSGATTIIFSFSPSSALLTFVRDYATRSSSAP